MPLNIEPAKYREVLVKSLGISGEAPEYFARYKMKDFKFLVNDAMVPADGSFLDFGSGVGAAIPSFKEFFPDARLTCTDISGANLEFSAAAHGDAATYVPCDEAALPFSTHSFDGVFASCVFHHIASTAHIATLREIHRVTKPGGILMLYEHNPLNPLTVRSVNSCPFDEDATLIGAHTMAQRCAQAGWNSVEIAYRVFFPAALAFLRGAEWSLRRIPLGAQYFVSARA